VRHQTVTLNHGRSKSRFSPTVVGIRAAFAEFGVTPAEPRQIAEAQAFATRLIGGKLVSPEKLASIHRTTGAGLFLVHEDGELTAIFAMVLLNAAGQRAVAADEFDSLDPPPSHVIAPGEEPAAIYGWGIAATNHPAAQRIIDACGLLGRTAAPHLPIFARPVTPRGLRLMVERMNFKPVPGSTTGLVWAEPTAPIRAVAAA
jgi:hypothetical protein